LTLLPNGELEVGVGNTIACLRSVDRRVNLQTNIKVLPREEIGPKSSIVNVVAIAKHAGGAHWSGGKTQPKEGQPPRRWKCWPKAPEANKATPAKEVGFMLIVKHCQQIETGSGGTALKQGDGLLYLL
jgi:hypothetical protein